MEFGLSLYNNTLIQKQAVNEVLKYNDLTAQFGLILTESQALQLVETRSIALKDTGRIEFGGGVIEKIIYEFCDSPYISSHNYEETLHELIGIFYYYKNETLDLVSDEDLIKFMKTAFDGICQGSLDLLSGKELYRVAQNIRFSRPFDYTDDFDEEEDYDGEY